MSTQSIKVVFGAAGPLVKDDTINEVYEILKAGGCDTLDTAQLYGDSEEVLGRSGGPKQFIVDTKELGGFAGEAGGSKEEVIQRGKDSLKKLQTDQVDIFYIHAPNRQAPIAQILEALNELYKAGHFKRLGLSNFKPEEVEEAIKAANDNGFVVPSVYQGNYSPIARRQEDTLFPLLRKHNIAFYAYSPLAGGFLTKTKQDIIDKTRGRFSGDSPTSEMYHKLYNRPKYLEALGTWNQISKDHDVSKAELAYRWVAYNSPLKRENGDAIIVGASSIKQIKESLEWFKKGPLPDKAVQGVQEVWDTIKDEAPLDNFNY